MTFCRILCNRAVWCVHPDEMSDKQQTDNKHMFKTRIYKFHDHADYSNCIVQASFWMFVITTWKVPHLHRSSDLKMRPAQLFVPICCATCTISSSPISNRLCTCLLSLCPSPEALTASESDGSLLIEQYAPCPLCASLSQHKRDKLQDHQPNQAEESRGRGEDNGGGGGGAGVHYFNMENCVLAAVEKEHIICPRHPEQPVTLQELVPELFMTDFPAR